ncbi:hypothetical protein CDAR_377391 [Caerostris darwini]|uniref:Uncharacterized protein n=1 Tax=Caerostris darwini TaxID=1538125 RepID=A0AAV4W0P8_9ARAC|nr:hypothetical protein CDAR_377391 [Caerostris darwini]
MVIRPSVIALITIRRSLGHGRKGASRKPGALEAQLMAFHPEICCHRMRPKLFLPESFASLHDAAVHLRGTGPENENPNKRY